MKLAPEERCLSEETPDGKPCGGRLMLAPVFRFPTGVRVSDHLCLRCGARFLFEPAEPSTPTDAPRTA